MSLTVIVMTGTALCFILGFIAGHAVDKREERRRAAYKKPPKD